MPLSIGVIGSGTVGQVLAAGYAGKGHAVTIGTRSPEKLAAWQQAHPGVKVDSVASAAGADIVFIAVAGHAAIEAVALAGTALAGKVVIDACNPISGPPVNGFLPYFTGPNDSLMERLQNQAPAARFVKAFSCVGNAHMIDPSFPGGRPTMFICGNDPAAKAAVTTLLDEVGWDAEDVGSVEMARAIEPLCQLWCATGFLGRGWNHAFKLVRTS